MIVDDRKVEEIIDTVGFVVATDSFMSGWGNAPGRSIVAVPFRDYDDAATIERRFQLRSEMKHIRIVGPKYDKTVRLRSGDHLHIYDMKAFRYAL